MANSGSGADDDSFFSTTGGGTTMPTSSGAEYRNSSTQASNSNFNSSGDRSSKNTSHHQQPSREGGRRDRYDRLVLKNGSTFQYLNLLKDRIIHKNFVNLVLKAVLSLRMKFLIKRLSFIEIIHYTHTALISLTMHNYLRFVVIVFNCNMQIMTGFVITVF